MPDHDDLGEDFTDLLIFDISLLSLKIQETGTVMSTQKPQLEPKKHYSRSDLLALEPRVLLDASIVPTVAEHTDSNEVVEGVEPAAISASAAEAEQKSFLDALSTYVPPAQQVDTLIFIDSRVSEGDREQLLSGVSDSTRVVDLETAQDGVSQISASIAQYENIAAVHIVSHGEPGQVLLGSTVLDAEALDNRAAEFTQWSDSLTEQADILLYGCDVSAGSEGEAYIDRLGELTGAEIAASADTTGAGGDWDLESRTGSIEADTLEAEEAVEFSASLATVSWDGGSEGSNNWSDPTNWSGNAVPGAGDDIVFSSLGSSVVVDTDVNVNSITFDNSASGITLSIGAGNTLTTAGDFIQNAGSIDGAGDIVVGGTTTWAGTFTIGGTGTFYANGGMGWGTDFDAVTLDRDFSVSGSSIWDGDGLFLLGTGTFTNKGTLTAANEDDLQVQVDFVNAAGAEFINAAAQIDGLIDNIFTGAFRNAGTLSANTNALHFFGSFDSTNGTIAGFAGIYLDFATSVDLTNANIQPGDSPGVLEIYGDLDLSGATTNIEVHSNFDGDETTFEVWDDFDLLAVEGNVSLGGTLNVTLLPGYTPAVGDSFFILWGYSLTGSFDALDLPDISGLGLEWDLAINAGEADELILSVVTRTDPIAVNDPADLQRVSVDEIGSEGTGGVEGARNPETTDSGRLVVFQSEQTNLVTGDSNGFDDIFIKDVVSGDISLISDASGLPSNGASSFPHIDNSGRFVTFQSEATNLVAGDFGSTTNGRTHIYLYDRLLDSMTLVSQNTANSEASGDSFQSRISGDGKWVFFHSSAADLVVGDTNAISDIFAYEVATGAITRLSLTAAGGETSGAPEGSVFAVGNYDGRYVAYTNYSDNAITGDTNSTHDVFVVDRDFDEDGIYDEFTQAGGVNVARVSVASNGDQGVGAGKGANRADISDDGRYVAFQSGYDNLVAGDTNALRDVFVHDRDKDGDGTFDETGAGDRETVRVSVATGGAQAVDNAGSSTEGSHRAALSNDGTTVVFESDTDGLTAVTPAAGKSPVYQHVLATGVTSMLSKTDSGDARGAADPVVIGDGSAAYFYSSATGLVANTTNAMRDVYLWVDGAALFTDIDTPITIAVLENDSDPQNDSLSVSVHTQPGSGTASVLFGHIVYTPDSGFVGEDSFVYQIDDGNGGTDTATVTVEVVSSTPESLHIALQNPTLSEGASDNAVVGELSTFDAEDSNQSLFTYSILTDPTLGGFGIDGRDLIVADRTKLDFESMPSVTVTVQTTDSDSNTYQQDLLIQLSDAVETNTYIGPVNPDKDVANTPSNWSEGRVPTATDEVVINSSAGVISIDPTVEESLTYSLDFFSFVNLGASLLLDSVILTTETFTQTTGLLGLDNATIDLGGSAGNFNFYGGTIAGSGTINGSLSTLSGIVTTLTPGTSPGSLNITGDLTLSTDSVMVVELSKNIDADGNTFEAGEDYDEIIVGGHAALDGTLTVSLLAGYTPVAGDTFDFLTVGSDSGTFHTFNLPDLSAHGLELVFASSDDGFTLKAVTTANVAPTVSLANTTSTLAENLNTGSAVKVADIVISDDVHGTNLLSLSGADAALFEIVGTELFIKAGSTLDHETNASLDVNVVVDDSSVGSTPDDLAALSISVTDVNEVPGVALNNAVSSIAENTSTTSDVKVADIAVSDDALGSNVLSLSGADAALFKIVGTELFIKSGTVLDHEAKAALDVSVVVDDNSVGGTPDATTALSISITDVNEVPSVTLSSVVTSLAENTSTASDVKVADIVVTDDGLGSNAFSLSGADAALFKIVGTELFIKAGTVLDYVSNAILSVTVAVDDSGVGSTPDDSVNLNIGVTDVNDPPGVALNNAVSSLAEDASTASDIKVADVVVTDDALGTNAVSLSGADAALFKLVGSELFLKAGVALDHETNASLDVSVVVDDSSVGSTPDDTASLSISVTDVNEVPGVALTNALSTIAETASTASDVKVADIVIADDALGTNVLSLSGADAALFKIVGAELFIKAGTVLDHAANAVLDVTVAVDDSSIGSTPDDTAVLSITVSDVNGAPGVALSNTVGSFAENTNTTSDVKVAEIVVSDDALGSNVLSLTGADAALFKIVGTELFIKAGTALDHETNASLDVNVVVDDSSVGSTPDDTAALSISITDVNEVPSVTLSNTISSFVEDTGTTSDVKVADIAVADDALGSNALSLSGADAALFKIVGTELFIRAGTALDHETNASLDVNVVVDDSSIGSTPDDTAALSISITDVNEVPSVTLSSVVTSLAEDASTVSDVKVADVVISDDALGSNALSLSGADAALFKIVGTELFIRAGTALDHETNASLDVNVVVDDSSVGSTPDDTAALSISVTDVNEAPGVTLSNAVGSLAENTSTASDVKVADIAVADDALGSNALSLSGADAALFKIVGTELFIKAGTALDHETNASLDVNVVVDDSSVGSTPDDTAALSISITDVNEAPNDIALSSQAVSEDGSVGAIVGDLSGVDPEGNSLTFSITSDTSAGAFEIVDGQLVVKDSALLDFSLRPAETVIVEARDPGGLTYSETFIVDVRAGGQSNTFTNALSDGDLFNPANWSLGFVPGGSDNLTIPSGSGNIEVPDGFSAASISNDGGTLTFAGNVSIGNYTQTSGQLHFDGGSFSGVLNVSGGTLTGSGTVNGVATVFGGLAPGSSPGAFSFNDLELNANSNTVIEVSKNFDGDALNFESGHDYDYLGVSGALTANGAFEVQLLTGYSPQQGDTFTVISAGSVAGDFSSYTLPDLSALGLKMETRWVSGDLMVNVVAQTQHIPIQTLTPATIVEPKVVVPKVVVPRTSLLELIQEPASDEGEEKLELEPDEGEEGQKEGEATEGGDANAEAAAKLAGEKSGEGVVKTPSGLSENLQDEAAEFERQRQQVLSILGQAADILNCGG